MRATQVFMAGDMLGVGVSLDGGATWLAPAWDSFLSWEMSDFSFDPALRRIYVASLSGPYYASFDAPLTWTSLRGGFPPPNGGTYLGTTQRVLVDPTANGSRLLAIGGNKRGWPRVGGQGIVWESEDAGVSWRNTTVLGSGANLLAADWCGAQCVWVAGAGAGGGMFQSLDGGRSWTDRSSGLPGTNIAFAVPHPTNSSVAYVAMCDGAGVFKTVDGGLSWFAANGGLAVGGGQCYSAFGMYPGASGAGGDDVLYAGYSGGAFISRDGAASWTATGAPPSAQAYGLGLQASFLSVHPADAETAMYATWVSLFVTHDGGSSWHDVTATAPWANDTSGTVWAGTGYSGLVATNIAFSPYTSRLFVQAMDAGAYSQTRQRPAPPRFSPALPLGRRQDLGRRQLRPRLL